MWGQYLTWIWRWGRFPEGHLTWIWMWGRFPEGQQQSRPPAAKSWWPWPDCGAPTHQISPPSALVQITDCIWLFVVIHIRYIRISNRHFSKSGGTRSRDQNTAIPNKCVKLYNLKVFYAFTKFQTLVYIEIVWYRTRYRYSVRKPGVKDGLDANAMKKKL